MVEKFFTGLDAEQDDSTINIELSQQMIGSLLYLAIRTRPDILAAVLILARFQQSPSAYFHRGVKRVLRYFNGTAQRCIMFKTGRNELLVYVDSDYAGDTTDRKSMIGYVVKLVDGTINWGSKKQTSVALSTCEAEYFAMSIAAQEVVWKRKVMSEIGLIMKGPTLLHSDNESAISWAGADKLPSKRAKHIDVRVHIVRDLVEKKELQVEYIPTEENDADMLTKLLGRGKLKEVMDRICLSPAVEAEC